MVARVASVTYVIVTNGKKGSSGRTITSQRLGPFARKSSGETLDLGGRRVRRLDTPHVLHCWGASLLYEEATGTLFTSDLFKLLLEQSRLGGLVLHG